MVHAGNTITGTLGGETLQENILRANRSLSDPDPRFQTAGDVQTFSQETNVGFDDARDALPDLGGLASTAKWVLWGIVVLVVIVALGQLFEITI